jgi:hypothetical protein
LDAGGHALVDIGNTYANADRICIHAPYVVKEDLKKIYGIDGALFNGVKDGDVGIYAVTGSRIVGKLYLNRGFAIKFPMPSGCKFGTSFVLEQSGRTCFIKFE